MELFFNFQAMERNGDVVAEIKNCNSSNCALIRKSFNTGKYKMCKDDISSPLFCSASDCLGKSIMMDDSKDKLSGTYLSPDEKLFYNARRNDEYNVSAIESNINSSSDSFMSMASSPAWVKSSKLQSLSSRATGKLSIQDSFVNGSKLLLPGSNPSVEENKSLSEKSIISNLNNSEIINSKLLLDYEAETSSSSIEEIYYTPEKESQQTDVCHSAPEKNIEEFQRSPKKRCESPEYFTPAKKCRLSSECFSLSKKIGQLDGEMKCQTTFEIDSNHNVKIKSDVDQKENNDCPFLPSPISSKSFENVAKEKSDVKSERIMPELSPPLICLDDEDSLVPENSKEQCEIVDVADSPKMPILIPFTSEVDESIRIKTEALSDNEKEKQLNLESDDEIHQPQVLLQRIHFNHSHLSVEQKSNISSILAKIEKKSFNEGPEIEEIEGVRFFQFRSKQEMEEFNRKPEKAEIDEDMIIPTKTTDITQIKGWRTKYFAPESQFHNQPCKDVLKAIELKADEKTSTNHVNENQDSNSDKKENESQDSKLEKVSSNPHCDSSKSEIKSQNDSSLNTDGCHEKILIKDIKEEKDVIKNPMSAFVSEELDQYLLNSSSLKVSLLEKINPNIVPIPPDAPILSLGKLRKVDKPFPIIPVFMRKREVLDLEIVSPKRGITPVDSPESPNVITLGSTEESSSEEDIPVAKLKSKKRFQFKKRNLNKGFKRKSVDGELDQASKRLVLRLTKDGNGVSKGYKVSDISCSKNKPDPDSNPSSPSSSISTTNDEVCETVPVPDDGSLPVIKQTLFSKKNEPHLLDEFLNNLNMYGTRKDVAMLVQANQSYFDEGPTLNIKNCAKAISVLVSNKAFLDIKQKSKKKKLKTWQKYLPKKLSEKQKMKLTKRKTRIQTLLDDARDLIHAERGKRSIRLPARYLDSAVLAASEWVSPVITIDDDDDSPKRSKRQSVDTPKATEENKSKGSNSSCTILPSNESLLSSSSSSSSSSPSSSSDENEEENVTCNTSMKLSNLSFKKTSNAKEVSGKRKKVDSPEVKQSPKDSKKSVATVNQVNVPLSDRVVSTAVSPCKKYVIPNCACKPSSRTAVFEYKSKEFLCFYCYSIQKRLIEDAAAASSVESQNFDDNVCKKEIEISSKNDLNKSKLNSFVKNKQISPKSDKTIKDIENQDLINCGTVELNAQLSSVPDNNQNKCKLSDSSVENEACSDELSDKNKIAGNKNIPPGASSKNSKFFLLLASVKPSGNVNNNVPTTAHSILPQPTKCSKTNKKCKPPILIRKTPTGLVSNSSNESSRLSQIDNSSCFKNAVPLHLPFNSQDSSVTSQSAALRLSKMAENASSAIPQLAISQVVSPSNSKDVQQNIGLINNSVSVPNNNLNSLGSSKVVTAYKLGDSFWLCNTLMPSNSKDSNSTTITNKVVTPAFVQKQVSNGPIISSVQSCHTNLFKNEACEVETLPNGLTKSAIINVQNSKTANEAQDKTPIVSHLKKGPNTVLNDHYYNKKMPQNRRKSPLSQMSYVESEYERLQLMIDKNEADADEEIDIETIDNNFTAFEEVRKKDNESESDISDNECADIFVSSTDHLASAYSKKSIKERKRRLLIKSGFENLKASSKNFKNAKSCVEILEMALHVIDSQKKKEKLYSFAKERLKIHNTMLLEKLMRQLEGIESPNIRCQIKMNIIKDLALQHERDKDKKSQLPSNKRHEGLTPEVLKEVNEVMNSNSERSKQSIEAPDIDLKKKPESTSNNSGSDVEIIKQGNLKPNNSSLIKFEEIKMKVNATLRKKENKVENNSNSTVNLGSNGNGFEKPDEVSIQICESVEKKKSSKQVGSSANVDMPGNENKLNKSPEKEYPGLIPLFHPKVYQENFSDSQSSPHSQSFGESSQRTSLKTLRQILTSPNDVSKQNIPTSSQEKEDFGGSDDDDDDDVSIICSKNVSPVNANASISDCSSPEKSDIDLTKAAEAANKLFGPCTVQKVQLKNGKTVFAYKPEVSKSGSYTTMNSDTPVRSTLPMNTNGVRNLDDVFCAINASKSNCNQNKSNVPEEIVILDSDDESDNIKDSTLSRTHSEVLNKEENEGDHTEHSKESDLFTESRHNDDSDSENEELYIDESCSPNMGNR